MDSPEEISARLDAARGKMAQEPEESVDLSPVKILHLDVKGTRRHWKGEFTYKVPTLGDQVKIGAMKSVYLPMGGSQDPNATYLVEQICYLEVTLTKKPDWWKPMEFFDAIPVSALYKEATRYESKFHGERPESGTDFEGREDMEESDGGGGSDVGRKVQPPAQRSETIVSHGS
jgi:hypothetical protein